MAAVHTDNLRKFGFMLYFIANLYELPIPSIVAMNSIIP